MAAQSGGNGNEKDNKEKQLYEDFSESSRSLSPAAQRDRSKPSFQTGFECEFVERPKELQPECPICLLILREPYQATCCGYTYCKSCIERVSSKRKPCPTCNNTNFSIFADKGLHKSLYGFKVWCSNKKQGCNWSGELRDLTSHLNVDPPHANRSNGCDYTQVDCTACKDTLLRRDLEAHEKSQCKMRDYTCEFCKEASGTYISIVEKHQPECEFRPVPCPNKCGATPLKKDIERHMKEECKLRPPDKIPCEFDFAGCQEMVAPDKLEEHNQSEVYYHLSLISTSYRALRERLIELQQNFDENNRYIEKLQQEKRDMQTQFQSEIQSLRELRSEFEALKVRQEEDRQSIELLQNYSAILPITFTLSEYESRKRNGDMGWSSSPFYTHYQGYKMCLWVDIGGNGPGKGIYISVFLSLMKGEYDPKLKWPFRGSVIIQLLNQRDQELHHTEVIKYHENTPNATAGKVTEEGRMSKPWGKGKFVKHDDLRSGGFVKNDCLKFRVYKIKLD